jgi:hypothetical protein
MGFAIIKRPVQLVNGQQSKWSPAHQPVVFEIERRDAEIINVIYGSFFGGGNLRISINANLNFSNVKKGGRIKIFIPNNNIECVVTNIVSNTIFDVKSTSGMIPSIGNQLIFLDALYYLEMKVSYVENNLQYKEIGTLKAKTDSNGIARFNVQELLATKTINQNNFLYNKINEGQWGEGTRFNIQIRQWLYITITTPNAINNYSELVDTNVFYYTNSANQIQNTYGYNMAEYVPTYDAGRTDKAKFQSVFKRPTYFPNYPFSLNFIYSDNLENFDIYRLEDQKDINGNIIGSSASLINIAQRELSNRLMLEENYTSNVKYIDIWLDTDGVATEFNTYTFDPDFPDFPFISDYFKKYSKKNSYGKSKYE